MAKPKDYQEALAQVDALREKLKEQKAELRQFKSENKIKRGKEIEDEKVAKQLEKLEAAIETTRESVETAKATAKELKPRKERVTKYDYPADCITDADKKKYRAKMRREKAKAEKGDSEEKPKKKAVKKKPAATEED